MPSEQFKQQIIELGKLIENKQISDDGIIEFFNKHRIIFMSSPEVNVNYNNPSSRMIISCSCGSRTDSCEEDGIGFYSQFYIDDVGNIFRMKIEKSIEC